MAQSGGFTRGDDVLMVVGILGGSVDIKCKCKGQRDSC